MAGIDVGGTFTKSVLVLSSGEIALTRRNETAGAGGPAAHVDRIGALAGQLAAKAAGAGERLTALGVAVPGVVDEAAGVARYSANLGWRDLDLGGELSERLGISVSIGHDVRLGALGEGVLGAARGVADFLYVPVGTGVAAAVVLDGHVRRGRHGTAGEVGHVALDESGPPCGCGRRGCLEAVASAAAIARRYAERAGGDVDAAAVLARASAGERVALEVWQTAVAALGATLAHAQALLDVDLIVVGGGLAHAGDALLSPLESEIAARLGWLPRPRLAVAALGDQAACLGAALRARAEGPPEAPGAPPERQTGDPR